MQRTTRASNHVLLQVSVTNKRLRKKDPADAGSFYLDDVHLLHEKGGVTVAGDAALQAIIEIKLTGFDNAFEAVVANGPWFGLFELAEGQVVGGEKRKTGIL